MYSGRLRQMYAQPIKAPAPVHAGVLQRATLHPSPAYEAPPIVHDVLRAPGQPLDVETRAFMEPRFGHDFSQVRVHTDAKAAESAQAVNARAYTVGRDIVFGVGQYVPESRSGQKLLAHELTHVVQQQGVQLSGTRALLSHRDDAYEREAQSGETRIGSKKDGSAPLIQRDELFGPAATGVPANWATRVNAATTAAQRAALVQEALGSSVSVVNRTAESAGDASPDAAHLEAFSASNPRVNYDDDLNSKRSSVDRRSLSNNAGYTLHSRGSHYIVLGRSALESDDFFATRVTLNHEFDHIRQAETGSTLQGNESEVDAWTSTFIREFHRTYILGVRGSTCFVQRIAEYAPLLFYYTRPDVSDSVRGNNVQRIAAYYNSTIRTHPGHNRVFRFWIHRTIKRSSNPALATRLNNELSLGIDPNAGLATTRQFDCAGVREAAFPAPPTVQLPSTGGRSASSAGAAGDEERAAPAAGSRRAGLEAGGGILLSASQRSAAFSLGARLALRADQAIIVSPLLGARLLYLPAVGDRTTHLAAAIGEVGLRLQQPMRGAYVDVRAGGYVGLELPTPGPQVEGGLTGALGLGYRWERLELGVEGRWLRDVGSSTDSFLIVGAAGVSF